MSSRLRAEARIALAYAIAIPFVVFFAALLAVWVLDATTSPTLSYEHELLLHTVPAVAAGAVLFIVAGLAAAENRDDAARARWAVRAAPLLLSAAAPTALSAWLILVEGHAGLNGLIVLPALILWGGVGGEWLAHRWVARGRSGDTLLVRALGTAVLVTGMLMVSAWVMRSPAGELEVARAKCRDQYSKSRTADDSAFTHQWKPTVARGLGTRSCVELLAGESAGAPGTPSR